MPLKLRCRRYGTRRPAVTCGKNFFMIKTRFPSAANATINFKLSKAGWFVEVTTCNLSLKRHLFIAHPGNAVEKFYPSKAVTLLYRGYCLLAKDAAGLKRSLNTGIPAQSPPAQPDMLSPASSCRRLQKGVEAHAVILRPNKTLSSHSAVMRLRSFRITARTPRMRIRRKSFCCCSQENLSLLSLMKKILKK